MHAELLDPVEDGPEAAPREVRKLGDVDRHLVTGRYGEI